MYEKKDEQWTRAKVQTLIFVISATSVVKQEKKNSEEKKMTANEVKKACGEDIG